MAAYKGRGAFTSGTGTSRTATDDGAGSSSATGDVLVAFGYLADSTGIAASGFTVESFPVVVGGVDYDFIVAYTICTSNGQDCSFTWSNSAFASFVMAIFNGAHATTPFESLTEGSAVAATGKVAPDVSSTYDNSLLADFYIEDDFTTWTPDAAFTERIDGGVGNGMGLATLQLASAGSTGTHTHTSGGSNGGIAVRMVIVDDVPTGGVAATHPQRLTMLGVS